VYQNAEGFRIAPPAGWVQRARDDVAPERAAHARRKLPLPLLNTAGPSPERLLVQYDRLTAGHLAWLRITVESGSATTLEARLSAHSPGTLWQSEGGIEKIEVAGHEAMRSAFRGSWEKQDYLCQIIGVPDGETVYFLTASIPASDEKAREEVGEAIATARWP
jgi:hypothetical protein